jgi:hypothetical protein
MNQFLVHFTVALCLDFLINLSDFRGETTAKILPRRKLLVGLGALIKVSMILA